MGKYLGHITLRSEDEAGTPVVIVYATGPARNPALLENIPKEFNHAGPGEQPRFQYVAFQIVDAKAMRFTVSECHGKRCLELHQYRLPQLTYDQQVSVACYNLNETAKLAKFKRMTILLRHPETDPMPADLPGDVGDLPPPVADAVYFNAQQAHSKGGIVVGGEQELRAMESKLAAQRKAGMRLV